MTWNTAAAFALTLSGDLPRLQGLANDLEQRFPEDFLTLWKDADPGIPILDQAHAEYARLVSEF